MKKLIEEYGQALVAIVVAIIFSILVFSFAYPMMAKSSKNTTDRAGRSDWSSRTASALPTIKAAVKPSISANSAYIDYGARFNIKNYVTAYDANGVSLINNVSIYSITTTKLDDNGKTINVTKKATKSSPLTFDTTKPGTYIVKYQVYARETALSKYVIYSYANAKYVVSSNKKSSTETLDTERFRAYASQYQPTKVVFIASLANAPPDTTDVSVAQNDSIQAWMDGDVLYVAQSGGVVASKNCSKLFYSGTVNGWQSKITEIDMSYLIEANITNAYQMFKDCSSLEHIYVYSDWDTTNISTSTEMFKNDFNLQGYQGTTYDDSYTDVTRAHLDNGTTQPGYFSVFQIVTKRTNGSATYTGTATNGGAKVEVLNPASGAEVKYGTTRGTYNYTSVPTYTNAGTYVVYFKVTASKFDDVEGELTIHIEKADSIISTPSAKSLEYNGKAQALINSVTSSHGTIQYKLSTSSTYSNSIPTAINAGTYTVNVKFIPDGNHNSLPVQNVTAKIKKATISYTKEPEANTVTYNGKAQELVTAGKVTNGTLQYSQDQTNWSTNVPTATNAGEYTVYYRTKGDSNYEDTPVEKLVATITKKEVELTVTNGLATYDGNPTDGGAKVTVTNPSSGAIVKYGKDDENFIYSSIPKYSEVGSYTVYYKVTADNYFSQQGFFTIIINPAVSKTMIPTAISGLVYNQKEQKLLNAGTSQDGTFYYSTDYKEDDTAEDNTAAINAATWTTTVPTGKSAGKYNIYWRFAGNDGFSDIAPTLITGEIGKADITINMSSTSGTLTYPNTSISFNVSLSTDEVEYNYVDNVEDEIDRIVTITRNGNNFTLNWVPNSEGKMLEGDVGVLIITNGNENYNFTMDSFKVTTEYGTIKSTSTDGKATYNGSATNGGASVTVTEPSTGYTIKYGKTEGTYDLDSIPTYTNAGTHTVYYKISAENYKDKTGKLNIVISKKTAVVTTAPKARDLTYNGSAQALVTAGTTNNGTLQYSLDNKNWSTKIPTGTNAGTYDVYYKVVGDSNHSDSTPVKLTVTIATGTIDAYATNGNTIYTGNATNGGAKVSVTEPTSGYTIKYGTSSGGYDSATIPTFVNAGTHTVYYQITAPNYSAYNGRFDIIINKANASVTKVPTAKTLTYNGSSQELVNAGTGTGGTFKYSTDNTNWSTTIPSKTAAGTYTVYYKVIGDSNHNDSTVGSVKVTINTKAMKVTATNGSATYTGSTTNGGAKVTVTDPTSGYTVKYGTTSGSYTLNSIPTYINAGSYTVYYQVTATNYTTFTGSLTIAISTKTVSISVTNGTAVYSGNATNGGAKVTVSDPSSGAIVRYGATRGTYNLTTVPTYTNAGTYTIYYQVTATNYTSKTGSLTITISKADTKVTKVPTAKSLVYTGSSQELVTSGEGTGGTFKYSTDNTNWSTSIPTKTEVGTYTVYYKVTGDSNHNDSAIGQLTVTIKSATATLLAGPDFNKIISDDVTTVIFTNEAAPSGTTLTDLTVEKNNGIVGWLDGTTYYVSTQNNKKVVFNTSCNSMFRNKHSITDIQFNNVDTSNVTKMYSMFGSYAPVGSPTPMKLTHLDLSNFDTSNVTDMSFMFSYCNELKSLNLSNFNTSKVTNMSYMFMLCQNLSELNVNSFDTSNVTDMEFMFAECLSLNVLDISSFNTMAVSIIDHMFSANQYLKTIYVSDLWSVRNVTNDDYMFYECRKIVGQSGTTYDSSKVTSTMANYRTGYLTYKGVNEIAVTVTNGSSVYSGTATSGGAKVTVNIPSSGNTVKYGTTKGTYTLSSIPTYTNAGTYTVYYQVTASGYTTKTGSVTITISKADAKITKEPKANTLTYSGTSQALVTAGTGTGGIFKYSTDGTNWSTTIPSKTNAGTYSVYFKVTGDSNHNDSDVGQITVMIASGSIQASSTNGNATYTGNATNGGAKVTVITPTSGYTIKYGTSIGGYDSATIPTFTNTGTYTVYYQITAPNYSAYNGRFDIIINKANASVTKAPTAKSLTYSGSSQELVNAGTGTGGTFKYSTDNTNWSTTIPSKTNAGTYSVYFKVTGDSNHNDSAVGSVKVKINARVMKVTATNGSATYTGTATNGGAKVTVSDPSSGAIVRYGTTKGPYNLTAAPTYTNAGTYTIYYQVAATNYAPRTGSLTITISKADAKVTKVPTAKTLTYTGSSQQLVTAGVGTGGTFKYSTDNTNWSTTIPTKTPAGTYTVYYKVTGDDNHNDSSAGSVKVTISKADAKVTTTPKANDLSYTGSSQELVTAGEGTGGTFKYSTDSTNWSTSIPTKIDAGTYTVYYKVTGDSNHNDSAIGKVTVTIKETKSYILASGETVNAKLNEIIRNNSGAKLTRIAFTDDPIPDGMSPTTYDLSEKQDGSVIAFCTMNLGDETNYSIVITTQTSGQNVIFNKDSSSMFSNLSMNYIDFLSVDTSNVKTFLCMFKSCRSLYEINNLNNFDTSSAENMNSMFYSCYSLRKVDVSTFDTSNVTTFSRMFGYDSYLTELNVSGFDTGSVTNMEAMFDNCSSLTELDLSSFSTNYVTEFSAMFRNCENLKIIYASGLWYPYASIRSTNMFSGCENIVGQTGTIYDSSRTDVSMANYIDGYLTNMNMSQQLVSGSVFKQNIPSTATTISFTTDLPNPRYSLIDLSAATDYGVVGWLDSDNVFNISTRRPNKKIEFNENSSGMFMSLGLKNIDFDDNSIDTSRVTDMSYMFTNCSSLLSLDLSAFDTNNVTNMSDMFSGCSQINTIYVSALWDASNVTSSSNMFYECTNIEGYYSIKYNSSKTDKSMANYTTGYLQEKNNSTPMHIEILFNNSVRDKITRYVPSNLTFEKLIQAGLFGSAGKIHNGTVSVAGAVSNCYLHKKDSAGNKTYVGSSEYPRADVTYWYDVFTGY